MKEQFNRDTIDVHPLSKRVNKLDIIRDAVTADSWSVQLDEVAMADVRRAATDLKQAKANNAAAVCVFGAHSIKNGLSPIFAELIQKGWITHYATNGAGIIHDWEFAFQGQSGEDVQRYATMGQFGIWQETGFYLNLSIIVGAWRGLGYGEAVGTMIADDGLLIPTESQLQEVIVQADRPNATRQTIETAAAAADLLATIRHFHIPVGFLAIPHPMREYSLSWNAKERNVPFTCHPMFGHDIIYTHPANSGAAIGRAAQVDFLSFVDSVTRLQGGVYLSIGSAVMSPMIFEKALSMARNVARGKGEKIDDFAIHVVDLAESTWDWNQGEPPIDNPAYYHRFCKTFSRMGGRMSYCSADNRDWLVALLAELKVES